jgi:hypothetical protein
VINAETVILLKDRKICLQNVQGSPLDQKASSPTIGGSPRRPTRQDLTHLNLANTKKRPPAEAGGLKHIYKSEFG